MRRLFRVRPTDPDTEPAKFFFGGGGTDALFAGAACCDHDKFTDGEIL
jgi:hypothetical protein